MNNNENEKFKINLIDINSVSASFCSPKKAWQELLESLYHIQKNFNKSQIDPEELKLVLTEDDNLKNNIPDLNTIILLIDTIDRYINEYKIPNSINLFLEFKRHAAVYIFSIGSQEKAVELLKEILTLVIETNNKTKGNEDNNLICIRDCVKLNLASINFWLENFDESKSLLEEVIFEYENKTNDLYLLKMVNFISIAFTYLGWISAKRNDLEDAEKSFMHALRVLKIVKRHNIEYLKEDHFINTKLKKVYIYDQLINFYTFVERFELCQQPLFEILKIMDKKSFEYDVDLGPTNHVYYYITSIYYTIKKNVIDFSKALHYFMNVIIIIYKNSDFFENIPPSFYETIFLIIKIIDMNKGSLYAREGNNDLTSKDLKEIKKVIFDLEEYLDDIIAKFDYDRILTLNPSSSSSSLLDSIITLQKFNDYVQNINFAQFNYINEIQNNNKESEIINKFNVNFEVNEIYIIKLITERMLFKFSNVIKDLIDCNNINSKICLEGLNGFLIVENDELILYVIYRYMARDGKHNLYEETKIKDEEDLKDKKYCDKRLECLKIISVMNLENRFAPLYYKRITYKLNKDAKTFNFAIYLALVNLLYSKKIYYPLVTLLSLIIEEISPCSYLLYQDAKTSQKAECFIYLFEFLLFIQVYVLILLKNFDRALNELLRINNPISKFSNLIYKILLGLCQLQCAYYDLATFSLSEAFYEIKPFIDSYKIEDNLKTDEIGKVDKKGVELLNSPESYLTEIRMFSSFSQSLIMGSMKLYTNTKKNDIKVCFRCRKIDKNNKIICLSCHKVSYCSKKCKKKNSFLHEKLCDFYLDNNFIIKNLMENMSQNYVIVEEKINRNNIKKK